MFARRVWKSARSASWHWYASPAAFGNSCRVRNGGVHAHGVTIIETDNTLKYVHGIVMFVAWGILCSVGILASAFRVLFPASAAKGLWFKVHRGVQIAVVVLCFGGFVLAVVIVADAESPHFDSLHKQLGLGVTAIALLQPINAVIRPHPPAADSAEKKSTVRVAWEIVHKMLGYGGWAVAQYTLYLGAELMCEQTECAAELPVTLFWSALMVLLYLALWALKCFKYGASDKGGNGGTPSALVRTISASDKKNVEMQSTAFAGVPVEKQTSEVAFVDEDEDGSPITRNITGK